MEQISFELQNENNIPSYLKERNQWLMWKYEKRGKSSTKVPYQANDRRAKSNDSTTWSTFASCIEAMKSGKFSGIGFVFAEGDGLVGIDLDHCFDDAGNLEPWARDLVIQFPHTYIEKSPSGDGLHIWCLGKPVKTGAIKWKRTGSEISQGIEIYNCTSPRFFTITGNKQ